MVPCSAIAGQQVINIPIISINPAWQLPGSGLLRMEKNTISSAIPPWQRAGRKIGKYYYYFSKKTGVMAKNTWIGKYYVNSKGQRVKSSDTKPTVTQSGNNLRIQKQHS